MNQTNRSPAISSFTQQNFQSKQSDKNQGSSNQMIGRYQSGENSYMSGGLISQPHHFEKIHQDGRLESKNQPANLSDEDIECDISDIDESQVGNRDAGLKQQASQLSRQYQSQQPKLGNQQSNNTLPVSHRHISNHQALNQTKQLPSTQLNKQRVPPLNYERRSPDISRQPVVISKQSQLRTSGDNKGELQDLDSQFSDIESKQSLLRDLSRSAQKRILNKSGGAKGKAYESSALSSQFNPKLQAQNNNFIDRSNLPTDRTEEAYTKNQQAELGRSSKINKAKPTKYSPGRLSPQPIASNFKKIQQDSTKYQTNNANNVANVDSKTDKVYQKMFTHLVKARQKSPGIPDSHIVNAHVQKLQNDPSKLKEYFSQKEDPEAKSKLKQLNKSCSQRLLEKGQTYKLKQEILRKFESIAELNECVFRPQINKSNSPARNVEQYIRDQESFNLSKMRKINQRQNMIEREELDTINKSHISKGSQKMVANVDRYKGCPSPLEVSQNLYLNGKEKLQKKNNEIREMKQYLEAKAYGQQKKYLNQSQSQRDLKSSFSSQGLSFMNESFAPQINQRSKNLKREDSIGNLLYNDAMQRQRVSVERSNSYSNTHQPEISSRHLSEKYIIDRYKQEFERALKEFDYKFGEIDSYIEFLILMGFVQNTLASKQVARVLLEDSQIIQMLQSNKHFYTNLFTFILAILNLTNTQEIKLTDSTISSQLTQEITVRNVLDSQTGYHLKKLGQADLLSPTTDSDNDYEHQRYGEGADPSSYQTIINKRDSAALQNMLLQNKESILNGLMEFHRDQVKLIHKYFLPLYYNRKEFEIARRRNSPSPDQERAKQQLTFKPALNNKTMKLADKVLRKLKQNQSNTSLLNNSSHFDLLIQKGQMIQSKKEYQMAQKEDPDTQECSFKPKLSEITKALAHSSYQRQRQSTSRENRVQERLSANSNYESQEPQRTSSKQRILELYNDEKGKALLKKDKTTEEIEYERSQKELTFQPNKNKKKSTQYGNCPSNAANYYGAFGNQQRVRHGISSKQGRQVSNGGGSGSNTSRGSISQQTQNHTGRHNLESQRGTSNLIHDQSNVIEKSQISQSYLNESHVSNKPRQPPYQTQLHQARQQQPVTNMTSINNTHALINQSQSQSQDLNENTFQFQNDSQVMLPLPQEQEPAYVIAIELEGVSFKIDIYEGDKPKEVIYNFFKDKNLNERVQQKIIKLITEQMKASNLINSPPLQHFKEEASESSCKLRQGATPAVQSFDP